MCAFQTAPVKPSNSKFSKDSIKLKVSQSLFGAFLKSDNSHGTDHDKLGHFFISVSNGICLWIKNSLVLLAKTLGYPFVSQLRSSSFSILWPFYHKKIVMKYSDDVKKPRHIVNYNVLGSRVQPLHSGLA